jgi:hypothetical protein
MHWPTWIFWANLTPFTLQPLVAAAVRGLVDVLQRPTSEEDTELAQKLGQRQPFIAVPTGMHGPTCVYFANLTSFSMQHPYYQDTTRSHDAEGELDNVDQKPPHYVGHTVNSRLEQCWYASLEQISGD